MATSRSRKRGGQQLGFCKGYLKLLGPTPEEKEKRALRMVKISFIEESQHWECSVCNKIMRSRQAVKKHCKKADCLAIEKQNPSWFLGWDKKTMSCRYCLQTFSRRRGIRRHLTSKSCPNMPEYHTRYPEVFGNTEGTEPGSANNLPSAFECGPVRSCQLSSSGHVHVPKPRRGGHRGNRGRATNNCVGNAHSSGVDHSGDLLFSGMGSSDIPESSMGHYAGSLQLPIDGSEVDIGHSGDHLEPDSTTNSNCPQIDMLPSSYGIEGSLEMLPHHSDRDRSPRMFPHHSDRDRSPRMFPHHSDRDRSPTMLALQSDRDGSPRMFPHHSDRDGSPRMLPHNSDIKGILPLHFDKERSPRMLSRHSDRMGSLRMFSHHVDREGSPHMLPHHSDVEGSLRMSPHHSSREGSPRIGMFTDHFIREGSPIQLLYHSARDGSPRVFPHSDGDGSLRMRSYSPDLEGSSRMITHESERERCSTNTMRTYFERERSPRIQSHQFERQTSSRMHSFLSEEERSPTLHHSYFENESAGSEGSFRMPPHHSERERSSRMHSPRSERKRSPRLRPHHSERERSPRMHSPRFQRKRSPRMHSYSERERSPRMHSNHSERGRSPRMYLHCSERETSPGMHLRHSMEEERPRITVHQSERERRLQTHSPGSRRFDMERSSRHTSPYWDSSLDRRMPNSSLSYQSEENLKRRGALVSDHARRSPYVRSRIRSSSNERGRRESCFDMTERKQKGGKVKEYFCHGRQSGLSDNGGWGPRDHSRSRSPFGRGRHRESEDQYNTSLLRGRGSPNRDRSHSHSTFGRGRHRESEYQYNISLLRRRVSPTSGGSHRSRQRSRDDEDDLMS